MVSEIKLPALIENSADAVEFVSQALAEMNAPTPAKISLITAVEEIFSNIAFYAYGGETGDARIVMDTGDDGCSVTLTFIDKGIAFDPLAKDDPDLTIALKDRPIGGLGILIVKKTMDETHYSRVDDENRFTIKKAWENPRLKETET